MASSADSNSPSAAPWPSLGSRVVEFAQLAAVTTPNGQRRAVFEGKTGTLTHIECHLTTLDPGKSPHGPHRHPDEELMLVKEGVLEVTINGKTFSAGPGSVLFYSANDEHGVRNAGSVPTTYHVFRFSTPLTGNEPERF